MKYDPIKRSLGKVFNRTPFLRIIFYKLLDILLLRSWHIRRELKKLSVDQREILDAGSGFGQYVYRMSCYFKKAHILGVDVKNEQVEDCNQFFQKIGKGERVQFEYADLTQFVSKDRFSLILSVDVMEHIEEDCDVFDHFYQSLKEDGTLLISTPSDQGGSDAHDHDHDHDEVHGFIDEHVRDGYGVEDIKSKLTNAGFHSIDVAYSYGCPGKISWKLSMKYPILLLGVSQLFFVLLPFYYLVVFPLCIILNYMDVLMKHDTGTGLIVVAKK
ncbi:class I SAM-dependent methyltransferase [Halosquirtibacter xylanolyticus]|uniref:class I SAM-dependent methyltransferase n=1 Tax=Halosquirtibacter xylanolyticus TaxID=3374599 RepID=UPI0037483CC1|nr:class I SAM-dependent methyltransferase [Prolixibacteraceae bacterium]